jgi:hypothetical protein
MPRPEPGELRAEASEAADVLLPFGIADVLGVGGAQPTDQVLDLVVVTEEQLAGPRLGDGAPQQVLVDARQGVPVPEEFLVGIVRFDDVEAVVDQDGGQRVKAPTVGSLLGCRASPWIGRAAA